MPEATKHDETTNDSPKVAGLEQAVGMGGGEDGPLERSATPYERKWAMVIDLDRCTGCHACETACYSENNISIVGPEQAHHGRAKQWIRVERYWEGQYPNVKARFMPIPCQHCDAAPCEPVCPVYATYHNPEGINGMVYNRCVGTRYCANNCPYSVRQFNWLEPLFEEPLDQQLNPDVTVRQKGVMEKCTFCIQRIRRAEEKAGAEGRDLEPNEFTTACAQACPPKAITWGNVKDERWDVAKLWNDPRRFRLLEELGTSPAVVYLKDVDEDPFPGEDDDNAVGPEI